MKVPLNSPDQGFIQVLEYECTPIDEEETQDLFPSYLVSSLEALQLEIQSCHATYDGLCKVTTTENIPSSTSILSSQILSLITPPGPRQEYRQG